MKRNTIQIFSILIAIMVLSFLFVRGGYFDEETGRYYPVFGFETQSPEECYYGESYDPVEQLCYIRCSSYEECEAMEADIIRRAEELYEAEQGLLELDASEEELTEFARYVVTSGNVQPVETTTDTADQVLHDTEKHLELWRLFQTLFPKVYSKQVAELLIVSDGRANTLAAVEPADEEGAWRLLIDIVDAYPDGEVLDRDGVIYSLIHEFAHLVSLDLQQVEWISPVWQGRYDCGGRYAAEDVCANEHSYLNTFYQRFWVNTFPAYDLENPESRYASYPGEFVSEYAATNPEEDFAESFTAFVLTDQPTGASVSDKKILFFYEYPELVRVRFAILQQI